MITSEYLREILHYAPETGVWTWLVTRSRTARVGAVAGHAYPCGYHVIGIDGRLYKAHRLAVLYVTGTWPQHQVDHVNFEKLDNRWSNLRTVTQSENQWNAAIRADNASGFKGVKKDGNRYSARIRISGVLVHLGMFAGPIEAATAYHAAAKWARGEYTTAV